MYKRILEFPVLALALSALCIIGCKKDPEVPTPEPTPPGLATPVKLTVQPVWNGAPFNPQSHYLTPSGQQVQVGLVKFYLAHFTVVENGIQDRLFDADLFDVTNGPLTRVLSMNAVSPHELRFGLGLPPEINHIDIATIPPNDPTGNNSGMYWTWASMYRFVLFEGHFDTDLTNTGPLPYNFSLHTGLDTCYRERSIPINLQKSADDTIRITLLVDVSRFFTNGADTLNLTQGSSWHGEVDNINLAIKVANLESAAFSVE